MLCAKALDRRHMDIQERFWSKVNKQTDSGCWKWTAFIYQGYGRFRIGRGIVQAHRWAWEQVHGPVPEGLELDHLCRNTACVNPDHIEAVTHRENALRGFHPNVQTHRTKVCKRGHEISGDNAYPLKDGRQRCFACHRTGANRWRDTHREQSNKRRNERDRQRRALRRSVSQP